MIGYKTVLTNLGTLKSQSTFFRPQFYESVTERKQDNPQIHGNRILPNNQLIKEKRIVKKNLESNENQYNIRKLM